MPGNHDKCHPMKGKADKAKAYYEEVGFKVLGPQVELDTPLLGKVLLTHFPEKRCVLALDVRYPEWRPNYNGVILCGHVHNHWKTKNRCINVGVDVWGFSPVSETELAAMLPALTP